MCVLNSGPEALIAWGCRLLYLTMFISCMVAYTVRHIPFVFPFFMGIMVLCVTALFVVNSEAWDELDDMYLMDISHFDDSRME